MAAEKNGSRTCPRRNFGLRERSVQMSSEMFEIPEDQLQEISGGLQECRPSQVPTVIHVRETGTWYVGCDG